MIPLFLGIAACGESPNDEGEAAREQPQQHEQVTHIDIDRLRKGVPAAVKRQVLYHYILNHMCGAPFVQDADFDDYFSPNGPGLIRYQCEHTVNPTCAANYGASGGIQTSVYTMSYTCQKQGGGSATNTPTCTSGFSSPGASGNSYICEQKVGQTCFQSNWYATALQADMNQVTYICWSKTM
jgi:hypothetical protein